MMMSDSRGLRAAGGAVRFVCRGGLMWRAAVSACLPACLPALTAFVNAHLAPSLCGPPASGAAENPKKKKDAKARSGYEPSFQPAEQALEDVVGLLV